MYPNFQRKTPHAKVELLWSKKIKNICPLQRIKILRRLVGGPTGGRMAYVQNVLRLSSNCNLFVKRGLHCKRKVIITGFVKDFLHNLTKNFLNSSGLQLFRFFIETFNNSLFHFFCQGHFIRICFQ